MIQCSRCSPTEADIAADAALAAANEAAGIVPDMPAAASLNFYQRFLKSWFRRFVTVPWLLQEGEKMQYA
jgi:hypothetical protein